MSDKQSDTRRKVLLGLTGGVAGASQLPTSWKNPVVSSIILPAHAQTTQEDAAPTPPTTTPEPAPPPHFRDQNILFTGNGNGTSIIQPNREIIQPDREIIQPALADGLLSAFIAPAHAGTNSLTADGDLGVSVKPDLLTFAVAMLLVFHGYQWFFTANGQIDGGDYSLIDKYCNGDGGQIALSSLTATTLVFTIIVYTYYGILAASGKLPLGNGFPSDPGRCVQPQPE